MSDLLSARIIILNYNGKDLLPQCLPSIVKAASQAVTPTRVTLLDNGGIDDGVSYVKHHFSDVEVFRAKENRVLCSYNEYLPKMTEGVAILLNNDIRVEPDFVDPLMQKFMVDPNTFLVAPRVMSFDGSKIEAARAKSGMKFGMFWCDARYAGYEKEFMTASETVSSGFGAFSRDKFLELGGYDSRYLPGIMEDVDLCLQAQRKGYRLYYEPKSVVYHMGQASFKKKYGPYETAVIAHRNNFYFMWKNFRGFSFWAHHLFFLPFRLIFALINGNTAMVRGFMAAARGRCGR